MIRFIQGLPDIVERLVAGINSPAIQDMIIRIVQAEEGGVPGVITWLHQEGLIPRLLACLSPHHSPSTHTIISELLKSIITLCAPTPFNPAGGNAMEQQTGQSVQPPGSRDNRLIRELVGKTSIDTMVGYMLDNVEVTDKDWKGLNGADGDPHPADPFIVQPLPSVASAASSLSHICNILVELIRRNNSDFSEPHLFHTLRNRLMAIRTQQQGNGVDGEKETDESERGRMEEAMEELSEKMGIVHLGNLLSTISSRFPELHSILSNSRSQGRSASPSNPKPLTLERFRVVELYAELLHSSNMSILNRIPGTGPTYSPDGILSGGLTGLEALGEAIDGDRAGETEEGQQEEDNVTKARELPVSSGSTDTSLAGSEDVASDDEAMLENIDDEGTPLRHTGASLERSKTIIEGESELEVDEGAGNVEPPPVSKEDEDRLRSVLVKDVEADKKDSTGMSDQDVASVSHAAAAPTTATPSISSIPDTTPTPPANTRTAPIDTPLAPGDQLKQMYITHLVLPTVVDLFFEYPNNDFMHHVVYDLLQQILNGRLGPGLNRELVIELINGARLVERILDAQTLNDRLM
jgi:SIT4-associating protein SAP185/190